MSKTSDLVTVSIPNRAQRRSAARKVAAAGSAAVLASAMGTAVLTLSGNVAGAAPTDVTNCDSSGPGSLSDAIDYANTNVGPDTITITAVCTASSPVETGVQFLSTEGELTIVGPGADQFVIDGGGVTSVFYVNSGADFSLSGVTVQNGYSSDGGGMQVASANDVTISNVVFRDNVASQDGGALYIDGSAAVTITNSRFEDNSALYNGGALYLIANAGPVVISNSTFTNNDAGANGGAISIYEHPGSVGIYNSTITGNTAAGLGAAVFVPGLYNDGTFLFNTIADNEGYADDGIYIGYYGGRTITFGGNIVASADDGLVVVASSSETVVSYHNDFFGGIYGFTPDATDLNVDPQLEPLADNGGPTPTRALAATSPVIGQGPTAWTTFAGDGFDQRGTPHARVVGGQSDIGAFEYEAAAPPPDPTPDPTPEPSFTG